MKPRERRQYGQRAPQRKRLPWLALERRQAVPDDFRRYLMMCFKAESLRRNGLHAEVRGCKRRWLILIEGRGG